MSLEIPALGSHRCSSYGNGFFTIVVDGYVNFLHCIVPLFSAASDQYVWRGMRDPSWNLVSTLARELEKMPIRINNDHRNHWKIEATKITIDQLTGYLEQLRGLGGLDDSSGELHERLLAEKKMNHHSFLEVIRKLEKFRFKIYELFATGQHHDLLTPFMDWTTNPFAALFFAFYRSDSRADGDGDRVVYALNRTQIEEDFPARDIESVIFTESMAYDNPRIIGQSGLFTFTPTHEPLDRWVVKQYAPKPKLKPILIRFLIQNKSRSECLRKLEMIGIHNRSIFPDRHGAAQEANSKTIHNISKIKLTIP